MNSRSWNVKSRAPLTEQPHIVRKNWRTAMSAKWIAIPALAAALVLGGALTSSIKAADNMTAQDFSSKGKGHAKGHAKGHSKWHANGHWRSAYAYKSRGAHSPHFCPPGQAKKPGLGSAHRC
jgi:hypothetical protein